jgi:type I restriction enzyme R subunit
MRVVYTESETVEKPILGWLQEQGWRYLDPEKTNRPYEDPFILNSLESTISRLNPTLIKSKSDVDKIIDKLRQFPNDIRGNKEFFDWIRNEGSISLRTGEKNQTVKLIDYEHPENNVYEVTNQYTFYGYQNIRPDIILLINGIPVILVECKTQTNEAVDYTDAIKQIIRYDRDAPQLTKYLAFCCATDGANFRYGWTNEGRYAHWRTSVGDPYEQSIKSLLERENVLDLLLNFVVFETAHEEVTKKIAMQQQVEGTNRIIERVLSKEAEKGLIWHTQGSGKTLTMLFTAWRLKRQPELENPTIIVVIDRLELQRQMRETFGNVGLPYVTWAKTTRALLEKIRTQSREVIITTIQKFRKPAYQDTRSNIVILIDEAHRTQYGLLAIRMRETFPNARIFGFTGTPIDKGPTGVSTFRTFCLPHEKYLHKYTIRQSIEDGSTVPIIYEPRLTKEHVPKEILDKEFLRIAEKLTEEEQEEVMRKAARLRTILKAEHRVEKVAKDIAEHYLSHVEPNGFKAQLVAVDREACALYKEELDKHLPPEYSTVIYSKSQNDPELLRKYHMPREEQLKISRQEYQKQGVMPNILIVTDMLLTGFDAPVERVMYLDKPLRDHKLLQAIARTNRPYVGKDSALIVDYVGIFYRLQDALNFEAEDIEGVAEVLDSLKKEFEETISSLRQLLSSVPREDSRESQIAVIKLLTDEEVYKRFKERLFRAQALFETIAPDPSLAPFLMEYTWFNQVNELFNKHLRAGKESLKPYMEKTRELIRKTIILKEIDKSLPSFEIGADYLSKLNNQSLPVEVEVAELRQALKHYIRINIELNPILELLSERLERIVKGKDPELVKQGLRELVDEINRMESSLQAKGISHEEHALLTVMQKHIQSIAEAELIPVVKLLVQKLSDGSLIFPGWEKKEETRKAVERMLLNGCFECFKTEIEAKRMEPYSLVPLVRDLMDYVVRYRTSPQ